VRRALLLVLVLAACESRYGAYMMVQGDIEFDEVELYFGVPIDSSGPGNGTAFATPSFGAQQGKIYDRVFDASDAVKLTPTTATTFYLPPDDNNAQLGSYVVAVALAGGHPVGIAEYFDFEVPTDVVHQYVLDLVPWDAMTMDRWGERPGCVEWKKQRDSGSIVAVVHDDDRDCDSMSRDMDCSDLCSAQSPSCISQSFCDNVSFCALGCSSSGLCRASVCLPDQVCSNTMCATLSDLQSRIACGREATSDHIELYVDRMLGTDVMCARTFTFAPNPSVAGPVPCLDPKLIELSPGFDASYAPKITQSPTDPMTCTLDLTGTTTTIGDLEEHHALVSIAPSVVGPRMTFIVGVVWSRNDGCTPGGGYFIDPLGKLFECK
jgi:hypothetical protein